MNKNIIELKREIAKIQNEMLATYAKLVADYEGLRQIYEKIIEEYEAEETEVAECAKIKIVNKTVGPTRFELLLLDGTVAYESEIITSLNSFTVNLNSLRYEIGTKFVLKTISRGQEDVADVIIEYRPLSRGIALFTLEREGIEKELKYIGTIYPIFEE